MKLYPTFAAPKMARDRPAAASERSAGFVVLGFAFLLHIPRLNSKFGFWLFWQVKNGLDRDRKVE